MTLPNDNDRYQRWSRDEARRIDYAGLRSRLIGLESILFHEYEPTLSSGPPFSRRLENWLDCAVEDEDQKLLLELAGHIYYVCREELRCLQEYAFNGPLTWWLMDRLGLDIDTPNLDDEIANGWKSTWVCPVTDSMPIAQFYHINRIETRNLRPDWATLAVLGDRSKILQFMSRRKMRRIVLLEDFVGSGSQALPAIEFLASMSDEVDVLICPLVVCPSGRTQLQDKVAGTNIMLEPIVTLNTDSIISPTPVEGEPASFADFRLLLARLAPLVDVPYSEDPFEAIYGFGITGAICVLFGNCPNNSLPVFHHTSETWTPLFPRSARVSLGSRR